MDIAAPSPSGTGRNPRVTPAGDGTDTVTVMVYMCGSDLESDGGAATADINEMLYANASDQVNVVIQTGGASEWQNNVIDADTCQRWLVTSEGLELAGDAGQQNMTDPQTLAEFVRFCAEHYPANRNILVFWDHGGGTLGGYGSDEHYPDGTMSLSQIDQALTDAGTVFDWIGFDCCMMGTVETAFVAEKHADYLIASQRSEPGGGWYYTDWLNAIAENPSLSSPAVGKIIVDSFIREERSGDYGDELTLSMIDLTSFAPFMDALYAYLASVNTELVDTSAYKEVSKARYDSRSIGEEEYDQVDLNYLVNNISLGDSTELLSKLDDTVLISEETAAHYAGLSLYFPYASIESVGDTLSIAKSIGLDTTYQKFVSDFASLMAGGQLYSGGGSTNPLSAGAAVMQDYSDQSWLDAGLVSDYESYYQENNYDSSTLAIVEKDGQYVLEMSQADWDLISSVYLEVFLDAGDGYLHLGSDDVAEYNSDGDLIVSFDDNSWVALNGHIVSFFAEQSGDENTWTGYVPAYINGEEAHIILVWTNDSASVAGYEPVYDTNLASRGLLPLQDGDVIEFLGDFYTYDGDFDDSYIIGTITVDGELTVSYEDVGDGDCLVYYSLHDIYENVYWTESLVYSSK
ncbi:MAG TPA: clostripain-related cysteine peptidase [Clostridia bacterium]|nr:clostripain-related cysteine peptidase [Clostridia bacterium]